MSKFGSIDKLVIKYLTNKKSIDDFLEEVTSMNIGETPESSPKIDDEEEEKEKEDEK